MSLSIILLVLCFTIGISDSKSVIGSPTNIRSDVIVTTGFSAKPLNEKLATNVGEDNDKKPGWIKSQLLRFGNMFGSIGNKLGGFTGRVTNALDKLCEVIKTIIPVVAAVCHVGQFQFCGSVMDAPSELAEALAPSSIDLSILD